MNTVTKATICTPTNVGCMGYVLLSLVLVALATTMRAETPPANTSKVVIVLSSGAKPYVQIDKSLNASLRRHGYKTRTFPLNKIAKDWGSLTSDDADAYLVVGTKAAVALRSRIKPPAFVTYCMVANPKAAGLTRGHGISGVSTSVPVKSQIDLIKKFLPKTRSIGMLYRSDVKKSMGIVKMVRGSLPKGWKLQAVKVDKHPSVASAIEALLTKNIDIVWTSADASVYNVAAVRTLLLATVRRKIPVFGFSSSFVRSGAILGVGIDLNIHAEQTVRLVHRLLEDENTSTNTNTRPKTSANAHESPQFEISVNLIVARKLGIVFPPQALKCAHRIYDDKGGQR